MGDVANLDWPLRRVLGDRTAKVMANGLGLETVGDLLHHYPRRYTHRGELTSLAGLVDGEHVTVMAEVVKVQGRTLPRKPDYILEITVTDGTGELKLSFFGRRASYRPEHDLPPGTRALFAGKISTYRPRGGRPVRQLAHPEYKLLEARSGSAEEAREYAEEIIPVYPATKGLDSWTIHECLKLLLPQLDLGEDPMPAQIRRSHGFVGLATAYNGIHLPKDEDELRQARRRLKWDEAFVLQIALAQRRLAAAALPAKPRARLEGGLLAEFDRRLPFELTEGQLAVGDEIAADLAGEHPMHRLLQGDVGAGKAQPLDAGVLTPGGFRPMGDLRVGEEVVSPCGEVAVVTGIFPQGVRDVWRLTFCDGTSAECDDEHLWPVNSASAWRRGDPPKVLTTRELRAGGRWRLPLVEAPELEGDGRLVAPVKVRRALLEGLMGAGPSFVSTSRRLAEEVAWLVRSLGGYARCRREGSLWVVERAAGRRRKEIVGIEFVGRKPVQCISVSHPSRQYVTDGWTPTHNTVVALRAMLQVVDGGGQAALLAPTEVLAQQHHRSIMSLLGPLAQAGQLGGADNATQVALLTGSQGAKAKRASLLDAASGTAGIVVGTHALLQEHVQFADLGLVVVDEQHRFGVEQRDALREKVAGGRPHVLVMTATPIPRTVAMTVFGDLDTSVLGQLPAGRAAIQTHVVPPERPAFLARAWERIKEEVAQGHQVYIVCPRIGEQEGDEGDVETPEEGQPPMASVLEVLPRLERDWLPGLRIGVLHGKLHPDEKDAVMRAFTAGELDVLLATTVIEVGVDVANATVMVIMDADRFGVSQLHQLRGRVGRGGLPGLCLLVTAAPEGTKARERLAAVASTTDGFELSRLDLEQRREGDVLGATQAGRSSSLRLLTLMYDEKVILRARDEATALVEADPDLSDHPLLAAELATLLDEERTRYLEKT
jgi:ATP-dependent DNA helicase RecG